MRYRPLGGSGTIVSAVSLRLNAKSAQAPEDVANLIYGALEQGVNYFAVESLEPGLLEAVGDALSNVERDLVFITVRLGGDAAGRDFSDAALARQLEQALRRMGLSKLDAVVLHDPSSAELAAPALALLKEACASNLVGRIGVEGVDDAIDAYITTGEFELLALPYNLSSGWRERRRIIEAQRHDVALLSYDYFPADLRGGRAPAKLGSKTEPLAGIGGYGFLDHTRGWTAEQICLGYVLNDVNIATVLVEPTSPEHLEALAEVADREMPPALSAQVEMARFSGDNA